MFVIGYNAWMLVALCTVALMFSIGVTSYSAIVWHRPKGSSRIVRKCAQNNWYNLHKHKDGIKNPIEVQSWNCRIVMHGHIPLREFATSALVTASPQGSRRDYLSKWNFHVRQPPASSIIHQLIIVPRRKSRNRWIIQNVFSGREYSNGGRLILQEKAWIWKTAKQGSGYEREGMFLLFNVRGAPETNIR